MRWKNYRPVGIACFTILLLTLIHGFDELKAEEEIGEIVKFSGEIIISRNGREIAPVEKMPLFTGDTVITGNGWIFLTLGSHEIYAAPETALLLDEYSMAAKSFTSRLFLETGRVWARIVQLIDRVINFEIETPSALAGVRGTHYMVEYRKEHDITRVIVEAGTVEVSDRYDRRVTVGAGFETCVSKESPPEPPTPVKEIPEIDLLVLKFGEPPGKEISEAAKAKDTEGPPSGEPPGKDK